MKKKKIIFIAIIFFVGISTVISIRYFDSENKNIESSKKILEKKQIKRSKTKNSEDKKSNKNEVIENENDTRKDSNNTDSSKQNNNNNKSTNSNSVNKDTSQNNNSTSTTTSENQPTSQPEQTPPKVYTEWEKLGISEYDYYNTPSENEGELAFKGNGNLCQNEINRLINLYYDKGIDGGRHYTINGKYTHSYLGCGIYIKMNGKEYKYSEIVTMEKQGYFN